MRIGFSDPTDKFAKAIAVFSEAMKNILR